MNMTVNMTDSRSTACLRIRKKLAYAYETHKSLTEQCNRKGYIEIRGVSLYLFGRVPLPPMIARKLVKSEENSDFSGILMLPRT